jgi:GT2 family glycosyltransferase
MPLQRKRQPDRREQQAVETVVQPPPPAEEAPPGPRVTAIVVAYNEAGSLRRCLDALQRSKDRELLQILVMDNGSYDETRTIDDDYPDVTVLRLPKNFGRTRAMNILTRTAKADLLFFLSPRIEVKPETVSALADLLEANEEAAAASPWITDESGAPVDAWFRLPDTAALSRFSRTATGLVPQTVDASGQMQAVEYATLDALMISKYFVRGLNYFDDCYGEYGADAELSLRIRRSGRTILVAPRIGVVQFAEAPEPRSSAARAALAVDRGSGAAAFIGKRSGFLAGLFFRVRLALGALGSALVFREPGYNLSRFVGIISGSKIDGNQSAIL